MTPSEEVTYWLSAWSEGEEEAAEVLFPLVYAELRKIAAGYLKMERVGHTLQPTALVHEAFLRLVDQRSFTFKNRSHFFAIAAKVIRRILIDHAREARAAKRGLGFEKVTLSHAADLADVGSVEELIQLHDALERLGRLSPLQEKIVECRFFGGLTGVETAEVLGCSPETVKRHWRLAKAWLYRELQRR